MKKWITLAVAGIAVIGAFMLGLSLTKEDTPDTESSYQNEQQATSSGTVKDMTGQGLTEFPVSILGETDIRILNLENNQIVTIPAEITELTNVEELLISNNRLSTLPAELGQMKNLKKLDLSNNRLTSVPLELGSLTGLEVLNLKGNNIPMQDVELLKAELSSTDVQY